LESRRTAIGKTVAEVSRDCRVPAGPDLDLVAHWQLRLTAKEPVKSVRENAAMQLSIETLRTRVRSGIKIDQEDLVRLQSEQTTTFTPFGLPQHEQKNSNALNTITGDLSR
jgi:hypothetical protein